MLCKMRVQWIMLFSLYGLLHGQQSMSPSERECCEDGRKLGLEGQDCTNLPRTSYSCRVAKEKCCLSALKEKLCNDGIKRALGHLPCDRHFFHGEPSKIKISALCCECCSLGLMAAGKGSNCNHDDALLAKHCAQTAESCCAERIKQEIKPNGQDKRQVVFNMPLKGIKTCADSKCSQLCVGNGACACYDGFQLQQDGVTCKDVNECRTGSHSCSGGQVCINTQGSYRCEETGCKSGYEKRNGNCQDIDECALGTHNCGPNFICINTVGSFRCDSMAGCEDGFTEDPKHGCIDINECAFPKQLCAQECINTDGSFQCSCTCGFELATNGRNCEEKPKMDFPSHQKKSACAVIRCSQLCVGNGICVCRDGFRMKEDGVTCEDVNECRTGSHSCSGGQVCINTQGSYRCEETGCKSGYEKHNGNCQDIDECALGTHNCGPNFICINTVGSFRCDSMAGCEDGFTEDPKHGCIDINECAFPKQLCAQECINTDGSFQCSCTCGFELATNGRNCEDVNECRTGSHSCSGGQVCINTQGSYRCEETGCKSGYEKRNGNCQDIDECALGTHNCGPNFICINTVGSFRCDPMAGCEDGFTEDPKHGCIDINECAFPKQLCAQECINTDGSFQCSCTCGFELATNGRNCEDVNECRTGSHSCSGGQVCINTQGSYRCEETGCKSGYEKHNGNCQDIDECALGTHNCGPNFICINTVGSFRCDPMAGCEDDFTEDPKHGCIEKPKMDFPSHQETSACAVIRCSQLCVGDGICVCRDGFRMKEDGVTCEDVNECRTGSHSCSGGQVCINTQGSYRCEETGCKSGYEKHNDNCQDIDECALGTHNCRPNFICINTVGSFHCDPMAGCEDDFNEDPKHGCIEKPKMDFPSHQKTSACAVIRCSQLCVGDGICVCRDGFRMKEDGVTCEDVNECRTGSHSCTFGQVCINTQGSYRCEETGCKSGYKKHNGNCQDIDECALGTHNCRPNFICINTVGSFRCDPVARCEDGFFEDPKHGCIDINECAFPKQLCAQECINTDGSFQCSCTCGFEVATNGRNCEDIDECLLGTHDCEPDFICTNTPGAFHCDPLEGCPEGFTMHPTFGCQDINECESKPCSQDCTNVYGSYHCSCRSGYILSEIDGITCEDIDECALSTGDEVCSFQCTNTPGSFSCSCPPGGYKLGADGRTCEDIDECALGTHTCSASEICFNVQGGYRCLSFTCPPYYKPAAEGSDIVSLNQLLCCVKACQPYDANCVFNLVHLITHTAISLPTLRDCTEPKEILELRITAEVSPYKGASDVSFEILAADDLFSFDVVKRSKYGSIIGVIRQRKRIIGPKAFVLKVAVKYFKLGHFTHQNIVMIQVFISELWF